MVKNKKIRLINPLIDCVFKALLGNEKHKTLLIDFLNAILEKEENEPIVSVTILNPYNEQNKQYIHQIRRRIQKAIF